MSYLTRLSQAATVDAAVYAKGAGGSPIYEYDCPFNTGLTIVTAQNNSITVIYE